MADTLVVGGTYRFRPNVDGVTLDGVVWDLTGGTVKLYLRRPGDGVVLEKTATIDDAVNGLAYYDSLTTDLSVAGWWQRAWEITVSGVVQPTRPIRFEVDPNQAQL